MTTEAIPKGYKQTEIGIIPEDWEVDTIEEVAKVFRGGSPRPIESFLTSEINGVNWIKIGDVSVNSKYIVSTKEKIIPEGIAFSRFVKKGAFILSNSMSFGRPYILKIDGCIHDGWLVIQDYEEKFNRDFLYYVLRHSTTLNQYKSLAAGSGVLNLKKEIVNEVLVQYPSIPEQEAIATALSETDELIQKLDKLISKKKDIKKGAMQELLTGKKRLPGFSGEWVEKKLGDIANFEHGHGLAKADLIEDGDKKCIHYGQLFTDYKESIKAIKFKTNISENLTYSKANDVLMPTSDVTPRGLATASCIHEKGVVLGGGILIIRLHEGYNGVFLSYFITQNKEKILKLTKGSTVFHIYANDLSNLEISFPGYTEQTEIIKVLSDMDSEIEELEQKRNKYQMIKEGMMQQLLTGRIRLKY